MLPVIEQDNTIRGIKLNLKKIRLKYFNIEGNWQNYYYLYIENNNKEKEKKMKKVPIKDIQTLDCFRSAVRQGQDFVRIYPNLKWQNKKKVLLTEKV